MATIPWGQLLPTSRMKLNDEYNEEENDYNWCVYNDNKEDMTHDYNNEKDDYDWGLQWWGGWPWPRTWWGGCLQPIGLMNKSTQLKQSCVSPSWEFISSLWLTGQRTHWYWMHAPANSRPDTPQQMLPAPMSHPSPGAHLMVRTLKPTPLLTPEPMPMPLPMMLMKTFSPFWTLLNLWCILFKRKTWLSRILGCCNSLEVDLSLATNSTLVAIQQYVCAPCVFSPQQNSSAHSLWVRLH